jgi:signal transduction histidine kinase
VGPMPTVLADPTQMHQLFLNLVGNAVKFRRPGVPPHVRVTASPLGDCHEVTVSDNGIGIAPQHRARVLEVFRRLHGREEYEGTGIGLSIVARIVERHGGQLEVGDGVDGGAAFTFTLPAP